MPPGFAEYGPDAIGPALGADGRVKIDGGARGRPHLSG